MSLKDYFLCLSTLQCACLTFDRSEDIRSHKKIFLYIKWYKFPAKHGLVSCEADHSFCQTDLQDQSDASPQQTRSSPPSGSVEVPNPASLQDVQQAYQQAGMTSDVADLHGGLMATDNG